MMDDIDINFLSDSTTSTVSKFQIINIFDLVKAYVLQNPLLSEISLVVDIIECKEFKGMAFMKIKDDTASISAIIYKYFYNKDLKPDDKIKIFGSIDVYRGQIQLNIKSYQKIMTHETNSLSILKNKLAKLGYFENKPIMENNYDKIGIISSMNAAGLKDFLSTIVARCRDKKLYIYPSSVQGKDCVDEICQAIELANKHNSVEILVMVRGGGGKEDLECFNSEKIAHSIFQSKIPIVTGIGHQIDTCIADLVCAKAYITPTAVAQNITIENINSKQILKKLVNDIQSKIIRILNRQFEYLEHMKQKLEKYHNNLLKQVEENLSNYQNKSHNTKKQIVTYLENRFDYLVAIGKELDITMVSYCHHINNKIKLCQNRFSSKDTVGKIIQIYDEQLKILSRPKIIDKYENEIILIKNLVEGEKYQICFIDGNMEFVK